eukprot:4069601-Amphidinium_carterae.2
MSICRLSAGWPAATALYRNYRGYHATQCDDGACDAHDHCPLELRQASNGLFLAAGLRAVSCLSIWAIPALSIWMQILMTWTENGGGAVASSNRASCALT